MTITFSWSLVFMILDILLLWEGLKILGIFVLGLIIDLIKYFME